MILNSNASNPTSGLSTDGADTVVDVVAGNYFGTAAKIANDLMAVRNASVLNIDPTNPVWVTFDGITYIYVPPSTERVFLNLPTITTVKIRDYSYAAVGPAVFITLWG